MPSDTWTAAVGVTGQWRTILMLAGWTLVTVFVTWSGATLAARFAAARVTAWLTSRRPHLAASIVSQLRARVPLWGFLFGVWLAAGYWPLTPEVRALIDRGVFVLAAVSITLAIATLVTDTVDSVANLVAPTCRSLESCAAWCGAWR